MTSTEIFSAGSSLQRDETAAFPGRASLLARLATTWSPCPSPWISALRPAAVMPGKFLEVLAKRKTSQALVLLLKAQPHRALLVEASAQATSTSNLPPPVRDATDTKRSWLLGASAQVDGRAAAEGSGLGWSERSIEAELVQPGDVLRVLPGAQASFGSVVAWSPFAKYLLFTPLSQTVVCYLSNSFV